MTGYLSVVFVVLMQLALTPLITKAQPRCSFQHYSTADGLSDNRVTCIMKDNEGFIWMGTWAGINRFDGQNFVIYKSRPGDGTELKNNRIDNIFEDKDGFLWVQAYDKKIYRFNKKTEKFFSISKLLETHSKRSIEADRIATLHGSGLAVITKGKGIFLVSSGNNSEEPVLIWFSTMSEPDHVLPSDDVLTFYQDSLKRIWIGSANGLSCFIASPSESYRRVDVPADITNARVTAMAENTDFIFLATEEGRLFRLNKNDNSLSITDLKAGRVNALKFSRSQGKLFCSTVTGKLIAVSPDLFQPISIVKVSSNAIFSIYEDSSSRLWVEPQDVGVLLVEPEAGKFKHFKQDNFANYLLDASEYGICEDRRGTVFVRMKGCGFGYFDNATQSFRYFYNDPHKEDYRFSNMTRALYYDPDGILWLSSAEGGLEKITLPYNEFGFSQPVDNTHLKAENEVRAICRDSLGRLWITNKAGKVYVLKDGKLSELFVLPNPVYGIYSIMEDRKKNIWMGTKGNGLFKAEPVDNGYRILHYTHNVNDIHSISSDLIYTLLEDNEGRIWVGTYGGGINLIDESGPTTQFYHYRNKFEKYPITVCDKVRSLATDSRGIIWIGTTEGLLLFDAAKTDFYNSNFTRYVKIPLNFESLGDNDIQYIYRDNNETMWVLTSSGGLNKAIGEDPVQSLKFLNFSTKNGMPSDYLLSCVEDSRGYLWIATQNGLSRFDTAEEIFRNYNVSDGVPSGGFSEGSAVMAANGELIFGMLNGYLHFNPLEIVQSKIHRNIVFTNLLINNEDMVPATEGSVLSYPVNYTSEVVLRYDQNVVSIDYKMLDYRSQGKVNYAYRLVGFESAWRNNKNETRASFTNLPPGEYVFEVKSTNTDIYSGVPWRALKIVILPPPWKTTWAYVAYFLFGLLILWLIRRYALAMLRLRQRIIIERKLADLKINFFTNVSHELRTPLTLIQNPLEEISRSEKLSDRGNRHLAIVQRNAQRMSRFIDQLLDLRKVQSGKTTLRVSKVELVSFIRRILGHFTDLADQKKLTITVESNCPELFVWIDAEKIDIVIYNVLGNALKFSPVNKSIRVLLQDTLSGLIIIKVIDEGGGVPESQLDEIFGLYVGGQRSNGGNFKGTGIGLALSKELIHKHHGRIAASKNEPQGLIITIELKSGRDHFEKDNVVFENSFNDLEPESIEFITNENEIRTDQEVSTGNGQLPQLLLVEDNRDLRSFLKDQLSAIYNVETARNGLEGLLKAKQLLPDVVLSDVMMPEMDGITMLDKIKNDPSMSHIPVVLLSARFSVESQIEGLKYGADHYLAKPFRNDFLVASLNNLVEQRKRLFSSILQNRKTLEVKPAEISITSHDELFLKKVISIVEEKMKEPQFSIDMVAGLMNMSRSPFYKKLKSLSGLSPVEFVKEIRLKRSVQYLEAGEQNISTIAFEVGFKSAKYFSTCFRQRFNETPTEYIKSKVQATKK